MVEAVAGADSTFQLATGVRADIDSVFSRNQMHLFTS